MAIIGQSDVNASWCAEQDLPSNLIDEYNQQMQLQRELLSVNYSGQAEVTAVIVAKSSSSEEPQAKKYCAGSFNPATEGYMSNHAPHAYTVEPVYSGHPWDPFGTSQHEFIERSPANAVTTIYYTCSTVYIYT